MSQNKQTRLKYLVSAICRRHHFANPNTLEIVFSLLFLGVIYRLLSFLGRETGY